MPFRTTHTFAVLEVSQQTYEEIRGLLEQAGYGHAFSIESGKPTIDMHGIALQAKGPREHSWLFYFNGTFCTRCNEPLGTSRECIP